MNLELQRDKLSLPKKRRDRTDVPFRVFGPGSGSYGVGKSSRGGLGNLRGAWRVLGNLRGAVGPCEKLRARRNVRMPPRLIAVQVNRVADRRVPVPDTGRAP